MSLARRHRPHVSPSIPAPTRPSRPRGVDLRDEMLPPLDPADLLDELRDCDRFAEAIYRNRDLDRYRD